MPGRRCLPRSNLFLRLVQVAVTQILHLLIYYLSFLILPLTAIYRILFSHLRLKGNLDIHWHINYLPVRVLLYYKLDKQKSFSKSSFTYSIMDPTTSTSTSTTSTHKLLSWNSPLDAADTFEQVMLALQTSLYRDDLFYILV